MLRTGLVQSTWHMNTLDKAFATACHFVSMSSISLDNFHLYEGQDIEFEGRLRC